MPRGNGTGPLGRGPMTGRGMGYCILKLAKGGEPPEGSASVTDRSMAAWIPPPEHEIGRLKRTVASLEGRLENTFARIREIERRRG